MDKYRIIIAGIVQGVGFRPFVYNLSIRHGLKGWVGNTGSDVIIEVEADSGQLQDFIEEIRNTAPALAEIKSILYERLPFEGFEDFTIVQSQTGIKDNIFISPDVATCDACIKELKNKKDRRYMYPFINCTNCGPRFTIIKDIPYDRDKTTMDSFEMCGICRQEYTKPTDRRYHAQPVSCHNCGPVLEIAVSSQNSCSDMSCEKKLYEEGKQPAGSGTYLNSGECINYISEIIKTGRIAGIKGIGGYHLVCDALNNDAVERLRTRKHRDKKPFALMMKNLEVISRYCKINEKEIQLLKSPASPIVLLEKKDGIKLPEPIAPLNRYLGVMLPYNPIHHILFEQEGFPEAVVMTSGNFSSEPIFYKDDAVCELGNIADAFLINNRDIYIRTDDSVTRVFENKEYIIRRSRGYVPRPFVLEVYELLGTDMDFRLPSILACGGELKNVFCINKNNLFYLSQHIGDLENESTNKAFTDSIMHFKRLFEVSPEYIAYDLHPNYFSSRYAISQTADKRIGIQHHKAHIASCMAENRLSGQVIGVSFDGTGYGEDGNIWGGEFFTGGYYGFERAGHLEYVMMPGADSAVKHPWRMAVSYLFSADRTDLLYDRNIGQHENEKAAFAGPGSCKHDCNSRACENGGLLSNISQKDIDFTVRMLEKKLNCPQTSSMGRFFDAVSALIGINTDISYEGQAAVELEYYAEALKAEPYNFSLYSPEQPQDAGEASDSDSPAKGDTGFIVQTKGIIYDIIKDIFDGHSKRHISSRFHSTAAEIVLRGCIRIREKSGINTVALSGGVFQNITLLKMSADRLKENGFNVYMHSELPANDGGIALGQALLALAEIADMHKKGFSNSCD
ncbi:hydrogenase maturation protein HypF [Ruminiclostridium sufflavum DSM 19573]|uniref:Carbamoyltransferase n=1 Tax=Ruminiclostridium sufflavum DSM 19573 TaxID=1121337 RepID=A0A318XN97_9FIRM|nr:carbamoyltransferase HypF [Ruminiclostridium sufflavum]PYG88419.1 hydrogenase maturation protein HypF [Ruminiclostridium sufflavum DSM 19573]